MIAGSVQGEKVKVRPAGDRQGADPVWGLDTIGLHDRFWASRGISVVRRGTQCFQDDGPELYLLIEEHELAILPMRALSERLAWLKPRALRLRILDVERDGYSERVIVDDDDQFVKVRRDYRAKTLSTSRAWVTPERRLAQEWANAPSSREGHRRIKLIVGSRGALAIECQGRVLDLADPSATDTATAILMGEWRRPSDTLNGVYEFEPGVWLHETSRIAPETRVIPPVWIGAGVNVDGPALIGPAVLPDNVPFLTSQIDWAELRIPKLRLLPNQRLRHGRQIGKRAFDIIFSVLALICTLPLYPIVALAILIEDGRPIFFAHHRQTIRGRDFPCWKFRTMCKNAEVIKAKLEAENVCDGPQFYVVDDPRVLRVGKILRKFQIDELPQFWNVLRGHMSVVGPRPSPDKENQYCPAWREARLSVRPGVTGLWQVRRTREPETDFQEWIRYDLEYVQQRSWRLDLWVICLTIKNLIIPGGRTGKAQ